MKQFQHRDFITRSFIPAVLPEVLIRTSILQSLGNHFGLSGVISDVLLFFSVADVSNDTLAGSNPTSPSLDCIHLG